MEFIYLDLETTGLNPLTHQIWEAGWAVNDGPVMNGILAHSIFNAMSQALHIGSYERRLGHTYDNKAAEAVEKDLYDALSKKTVVGANPAFDTAMLTQRWAGDQPWHYRLLDIQAYSMAALKLRDVPSLVQVKDGLRNLGYQIPSPQHTAASDVECVRACHLALMKIYEIT